MGDDDTQVTLVAADCDVTAVNCVCEWIGVGSIRDKYLLFKTQGQEQ